MAKGLRASTKKANKTLLRQNIFGPIEAARKKRLSAKLLELASKSSLAIPADVKMVDEVHEGERKGVYSILPSTVILFYFIFFFGEIIPSKGWVRGHINRGRCCAEENCRE